MSPTAASGARRALRELHPQDALIVPLAIVCSTVLLGIGLSLPLMDAEAGILWKHWKSSYSVWAGVAALWRQGHYPLATLLFFFSMVFPLSKLLALVLIWFVRLADEQRVRLLHWLELLGKWSMLDVFAVAILIVIVKLGPLANVEARTGVYFFCAAILASMLTTKYVDHLARASLRPTAPLVPAPPL